jgi:hypothetical protein
MTVNHFKLVFRDPEILRRMIIFYDLSRGIISIMKEHLGAAFLMTLQTFERILISLLWLAMRRHSMWSYLCVSK